ncbi:hypothetical protein [Streptomyces prasinus]
MGAGAVALTTVSWKTVVAVRSGTRTAERQARAALRYPLGDGSGPEALGELHRLAAHLRAGVPGAGTGAEA